MFDGFWSGIFGGLFGSAIAQYLSRFKYWMIFFGVILTWQIVFLVMAIYYKGWSGLVDIFIQNKPTFLIIFVYSPIGFGALGILIAFMGSFSVPNKLSEDDIKK